MLQRLFFQDRFENYTWQSFQKDLISGLIVGVIAIPLGMAFAIASGVKPEYGIYTTIIAGILISLLGGSKYQIGGPTGAFIPILFGIVSQYGFENLLIAGFMAGIILVLMGIFKLGSLIAFIPRPVTVGFTAGIAVIIFFGQIPNFLGLTGVENKEYFIENLIEITAHIGTINIYSIITAIICLIMIIVTPKIFPRVPGPLVGLFISTVVATLFFQNKVATIGSTYGGIPNELPKFIFPEITIEKIQMLIVPAIIIAMLGAIESLLSAVVADGMTNSKHNSNKELVGQGVANIITPLFGGIPATGAIARTATNIRSGAVSPLSGVIHGFVVLAVLLLLAPYADKIPLASMAPILMVVAWNMSERRVFTHLLKLKSSDTLVLVTTFLLTVFINLTVAVPVGLLLAAVIFVKRMSDSLTISKAIPNFRHKNRKVESIDIIGGNDCPQVAIYNIEGPLFFGAAQAFEQSMMNAGDEKPKVLLLRMGRVPFMDTTGAANFSSIVKSFSENGTILISGLKEQPEIILKKIGLYDFIGEKHFFENTGDAIDYALSLIDKQKCIGCRRFAFKECEFLCGGLQTEQQEQQLNLPLGR